MQISAPIIRLGVGPYLIGQTIVDLNTSRTPQFYVGADLTIQVGLLSSATALYDISDLASLQLDFKTPSQINSSSVLTAFGASFDNTTTFNTFASGSNQHAVFTLLNSQTNLAISGNQADFIAEITATTTGSPPTGGKIVTLAQFKITALATGFNQGASPGPSVPTFYNAATSDLRYIGKHCQQANPTGIAVFGTNCPADRPDQPIWAQYQLDDGRLVWGCFFQ
jgi:hypothetical protein